MRDQLPDRLISAREAAEILSIDITMVNMWRRQGKLRCKVYSPKKIRYYASSIEEMRREREEYRTGEVAT